MSVFFSCFCFCLCILTLLDWLIKRSKNPTECLRQPQILSSFRIGAAKRGLVLSAEDDGGDDDDDDDDKCNPTS